VLSSSRGLSDVQLFVEVKNGSKVVGQWVRVAIDSQTSSLLVGRHGR
jgi:hypothetical protein